MGKVFLTQMVGGYTPPYAMGSMERLASLALGRGLGGGF
jgi:hypothetical protein